MHIVHRRHRNYSVFSLLLKYGFTIFMPEYQIKMSTFDMRQPKTLKQKMKVPDEMSMENVFVVTTK